MVINLETVAQWTRVEGVGAVGNKKILFLSQPLSMGTELKIIDKIVFSCVCKYMYVCVCVHDCTCVHSYT